MTDEVISQIKVKKPGLLRRIGWWIWVILLTALLVLSLVFAAPWKVITLIAIFLAAATILPRIYRKWFWLSVGFTVLAIVAWIFLPDDNKGWRPYQFDKELAQLQARYAVPDSENAAILYNQILADWKQKEANEPKHPDDWFSIAGHSLWYSKDHPEIAEYIKYYQGTIEQLVKASKFERCSFPINVSPFTLDEPLERNSAMRQLAYLLVSAGNNDTAEGKIDEAIEKYITTIKIGQHISHQPILIDTLVGIALEALSIGRINNFVITSDVNEFYLGRLEQAVSEIKHDWSSDLTGFIDSDILQLKILWGVMCYQINDKSKIRFSHDPSEIFKEHARKQLVNGNAAEVKLAKLELENYGYWYKKLVKSFVILYWFYMPSTPEKLSEIVDASFEKHYLMTKPDFSWPQKPQTPPEFHYKVNIKQVIELLAKTNESLYFNIHDLYLRQLSQQRGTLLIIALRRYKNTNGRWPEKLEDINNLAPAETFVYKLTDDNFTLYSKGKNDIDDSGKHEDFAYPDMNNVLNKGCDDEMIWPPRSKLSKQQEQKTEN